MLVACTAITLRPGRRCFAMSNLTGVAQFLLSMTRRPLTNRANSLSEVAMDGADLRASFKVMVLRR